MKILYITLIEGSIEMLGNPTAFVSRVSSGLHDMLVLPLQGNGKFP